MENELAVIAIKGGRYKEAENMFNQEISSEPTSMSYYGLGLCKLNLIMDVGRTTDEVFYCFDKALSICPDMDKSQLETDIVAVCVNNLEQLNQLNARLEEEKKKQANAAALGAALTIGAAMVGSSHKSNGFTQISSLVVAGAGVGMSLDGLSKLGSIPEIQNVLKTTANEIREYLERTIKLKKQLLNDSLARIKEQEMLTVEINNRPSWTNTFFLCLFLGTFGVHRFYVGKTKSGILMLLTFGGLGLWSMYDLVMVFFGNFKDAEGIPVKRKA